MITFPGTARRPNNTSICKWDHAFSLPLSKKHTAKQVNFFVVFFSLQNLFSFGRGRRWLTWLGVLYSPLSILLPLQICPSLTSGDAESRSNLSRLHIVPIIFIKYPISADYWGKHSWKKFWLYSKPILVFFKFVSKQDPDISWTILNCSSENNFVKIFAATGLLQPTFCKFFTFLWHKSKNRVL